jgi:TolB protein
MRKLALAFVVTTCLLLGAWKGQSTGQQFNRSEQHASSVGPSRDIVQFAYDARDAETSFSGDNKRVLFEAKRAGDTCPQLYVMNADGSGVRRLSNGKGQAINGQWFPDGEHVLYMAAASCASDRAKAEAEAGAWSFDPAYDIFVANSDGSNTKQLTRSSGYNGEARLSPDGKWIVFTSTRDGDPNVYAMAGDGSNVKRLTDRPGYDGGPAFSPDGNWILYRAYHPATPEETAQYERLLKRHLVQLPRQELWIMRADGSEKRQITDSVAGTAPYFFPDSKKIIFGAVSGKALGGGTNFDLYAFNVDGTGVQRLTHNFDTPEDKRILSEQKRIFAANQENRRRLGETRTFGALKVLAYVFSALALSLVVLRFSLVMVVAVKNRLDWLESLLRSASNTVGLDVDRAVSASAKVTTIVPGMTAEKRRARPRSRIVRQG